MGPVLAPFLISIFQFLFSSYAEEDGVRRRRGRRGREGERRILRRSSGPRGRGGGENHRPAFLLGRPLIPKNAFGWPILAGLFLARVGFFLLSLV